MSTDLVGNEPVPAPNVQASPFVGAGPMVPTPYRVRAVHRENHDTVTLSIEPTRKDESFSFAPGQFNMLYLWGAGEVPISISSDPAHPGVLAHTVRAVGAITEALCRVKRGQTVGVRGPFGSHWPVEDSTGRDVVIVAGGVGLPPLRPALYHVLARREQYGRVVLLYGARMPGDLLFERELAQWRGRFDVQVEVTVDSGTQTWRGHVGVVTTLIPLAAFDAAETTAFVCGPEVMMRFTIAELQGRGVSADRIYLSMERNMKCAIGWCGHCQFGPTFICKDGPVFRYDRLEPFLKVREL